MILGVWIRIERAEVSTATQVARGLSGNDAGRHPEAPHLTNPSRVHPPTVMTIHLSLLAFSLLAPLPARTAPPHATEQRAVDPDAFSVTAHRFERSGDEVIQRCGFLGPRGEFRVLITTRHHARKITTALVGKGDWIESEKADLLRALFPPFVRDFVVSDETVECKPLGKFRRIIPRRSLPDIHATSRASAPF